MSYQALYRKFRPQEFSEVRGQDHIVTTLKNQIKTGRIGHAYLFTGTRGTGKTSVAKLFAKALNCKNPREDGSPCGQCSSCAAANAGSSFSIIEMDAAANNGVDDIRQIIEEVNIPPVDDPYKVYIIDEVHEISSRAFNALLKTLEEPPSYAVFILATTEVHKLPITILSRCQRYDFHRISIDTITRRLQELLTAEGVTAEEKAVRYIAKVGDGSMRDSISLLDQCIAFYIGEELTYDKVLNVLGAVDTEIFSRLLRAVAAYDSKAAIDVVEEVIIQGRELEQFTTDFIWYLRNLMLLSAGEDMENALDISSDNLALLREEAELVEMDAILRYIRILSDLLGQLKYSTQKRVLLEIAVIKLCTPQMERDEASVLERVALLEQKLEEGIPVVQATTSAGAAPVQPVEKKPIPQAVAEDVQRAIREWRNIIAECESPLLHQYLPKGKPTVDENGAFLLVFDAHDNIQKSAYNACMEPENTKVIQELISDFLEAEVKVRFELNNTGYDKDRIYPDVFKELEKRSGMKIEVEE